MDHGRRYHRPRVFRVAVHLDRLRVSNDNRGLGDLHDLQADRVHVQSVALYHELHTVAELLVFGGCKEGLVHRPKRMVYAYGVRDVQNLGIGRARRLAGVRPP